MWIGNRRQFNGLIIGGIAMYITKNFTTDEMACSCCKKSDMCEKHNSRVSTTGKTGPHTHAKACDILISGADAMRLFAIAQRHGISGIGLSQKGPHNKRFCHIDSLTPEEGPRPTVWTYA